MNREGTDLSIVDLPFIRRRLDRIPGSQDLLVSFAQVP